MDSYAVLRGVSGLSDHLSKDRYYLDKMIKRSDDYGAGYQATIEARIAHHNQLVTVLNGLFETIGQELGEFAPEQALFPVYVDPRSAADAPVVTLKAPLEPPEPSAPVNRVEPVVVGAVPLVSEHVEMVLTDTAPVDPYVAEEPEPTHEDEAVQETSLKSDAPDVEADAPEPEPEQAVAPKEPVTAREHVEAALSQHEAATGTELGLNEELEEPTAVSVLPSDTGSNEEGDQDMTLAIPGFASSSDYQSVIHDDIARINGDAYGRPSVSHEADASAGWNENEPTDRAEGSSFDGFEESGDDAFEDGDAEDETNGYPEDEMDGYPDDAFDGSPESDFPDEDPFNERP